MRDDGPAVRHLRLTRGAGLVSCAVGAAVVLAALAGWALDVPALYSSPSGDAVTTPWTAVGFGLLTVATLAVALRDRRPELTVVGFVAAVGALVVGTVALVEYLTGWSPGVDELLFSSALDDLDFAHPGRPSLQTATTIALLGLATVVILAVRRHSTVVVFAVSTGVALPTLGLVGHAFQAEDLFDSAALGAPGMSLPTAVMGLAVGFSLLASELGPSLLTLASEHSAAARIVRVLLPCAFFVPVVPAAAAHVTRVGSEAGTVTGSLVAAFAIAGLTSIVWRTALSASAFEAQQRYLIEQIPAPAFVFGSGRIAFANSAAATTWAARDGEDLVGRLDVDVLSTSLAGLVPLDRPPGMTAADALAAVVDVESATRTLDGQDLLIELTPQPIHWEGSERVLVVARDITARRAAQQRLAESHALLESELAEREARLRLYAAVVESSPDSLVATSLDGKIIAWNAAAERQMDDIGYEGLTEGAPMPAISSDPDGVAAMIEAVRRGERLDDIVVTLPTRRGGTRHLSMSVSAVLGDADAAIAVAWVARDITERHEADERFRTVVESVAGAVVVVDGHGAIRLVNVGAEKMFGHDRDAMVGRPVEMLVPSRSRRTHTEERREFTEHRSVRPMGASLPTMGLRADGSEFPVDIGLSPIVQDGERMVVAMVADISERVAARRALERHATALQRAHDELAQFAYVASHDLQEPLRMVVAYTGMLEERYAEVFDERGRRYVHHVLDGAHRMQTLIRDLLEYTRLEARDDQLVPVDTTDALRCALERLRPALDATGAVVDADVLPPIVGQVDQIERLFELLIDNAVKFSDDGPPDVRIAAERDGDTWVFAVSDKGIGIDPDHGMRIFRMFQRLHPRGTYEGTGVGLALAKRIIERHGGSIWYESQPGEGTTFLFTLQADAAESPV